MENPGAVSGGETLVPTAALYGCRGPPVQRPAVGCLGSLQVPSAAEIWGRGRELVGDPAQPRDLRSYPRGEGGQASPGRYSTKGQVLQAPTPGRRRCSRPLPPKLAPSGALQPWVGAVPQVRTAAAGVSVACPKPGRAGECVWEPVDGCGLGVDVEAQGATRVWESSSGRVGFFPVSMSIVESLPWGAFLFCVSSAVGDSGGCRRQRA